MAVPAHTVTLEAGPDLLDRDEELHRLAGLLQAAGRGDGSVLALEGPPGIGKTRLLRCATQAARRAGMTVLAASGSPLERPFGFGVARQLFERELARLDPAARAEALDGAAALAGPALEPAAAVGPAHPAAGAGAAPAGAETRHAIVHGLYWLTVNLAARGPLLLVVDDLPLADPPSLQFLGYLARRLDGLPVALAVAMRPGTPGEHDPLVDAVLAAAAAPVVPRPLGEEAVGRLAREALGADPDPAFSRACLRATGGNALLVGELLGELRRRGAAPDARTARDVQAVGTEGMARDVRRRIDALPPGAAALTRAVAVLGDGCAPGAAAALADLPEADAVRAAASLAAADVLADAGTQLRFRHPVVRAAVADRIPAAERAAAHGRAARLLAARGAPAAVIAGHLRAAPPDADPRAVEHLRAAAAQARAQGLPEVAAAHLARALAEPPAAAEQAGVLRELGEAELAAELPDGPDHLAQALELLTDPRERGVVALDLAGGLFDRMRLAEAAAVARAALADPGEVDRETTLLLEAVLAECVRMDLGVGGDEVARLHERAASLAGNTPAERFVLAMSTMMRGTDTAAGHAAVAELTERAIAAGRLPPGSPETGIVSNLIRAGRLDDAGRHIDRSLDRARRAGLVRSYGVMTGMRGWVELERGALDAAEADLRTGTELAEAPLDAAGSMAAMLAVVLAERGRLDEADETLVRFGVAGPLPEHQVMNIALFSRARVRAAQGRREDALADALELGRRYERWNLRRAVPAWRSLAAVLLAMDGEEERARALAEEELVLARRWGTPQVIGIAQRGLALVTADEALLREAVASLAQSPARLELARAQVELGALLRRRRRRADARAPLREGLDLAHACGAVTLAERARDELVATGARPRRLALSGPGSLTVSERRVAELAIRGLTNRQIAQELFVTPATVETHLRHAFQKLDVAGRGELGAALAAGPA